MAPGFGELIATSVSPDPVDAFTPMGYIPSPRQKLFHETSDRTDVYAILFGGAAGGGKSAALLMDAIHKAVNVPGIKIIGFRRTFPELDESFISELSKRRHAEPLGAKWNQTQKVLKFPNRSEIHFSYAENALDASRIQGGEYQVIYIDECGLMDPSVIPLLEERLRSSNKLIPVFGLRVSSNPGNVGHGYLKDRFIKPTRNGLDLTALWTPEGTGVSQTVSYIRSLVSDNPHMNPEYEKNVLAAIPDPQRRKAMREGDWDAMVGQFFKQWSNLRHVVPYFTPPVEWHRYAGIDYGSDAPFACCWGAEDQDGRLWIYRELYVRGTYADDQALMILEAEAAAGEEEVSRVADPSMWAKAATPLSIADMYGLAGCGISKGDNDRPSGWARVNHFLNEGVACQYHRELGWETCPRLHVFAETCPNFIEKIPTLPRDKNKPDDADTHAEDHMADALRYMCMEVGTYARPILYDDVPTASPLASNASAPQVTMSSPEPQTPVKMIGPFAIGN